MIDFLLGVPGKLKTLVDYLSTNLSTTRAAKIDNADVATSTRAAAATALSTATWTGTKAGYIDMAISGVARIKSIQHVLYTYSGTATGATGTKAITSVDTTRAFIIPTGHQCGSPSDNLRMPLIKFASGTSVEVLWDRDTGTNTTLNIGFIVVEFY